MSKQLVKTNLNVDTARSLVTHVKNDVPYYIFTANSDEEIEVPTPTDTKSDDSNLYDNILFGKRVKSSDISLSVKRYDWQINQVYDMYDDIESLVNKRFYVSVDTGIETRVYKCLFNNNNAQSTVEPSGTSTESFETLSDGYIWKYMYSITNSDMNRFATSEYIPVVLNTNIVNSAVPGTIDIIKIQSAGARYDNYVSGAFNQASDISVNGNPLVFDITNGEPRDNFYVNCMIKLTSIGPQNGQYRLITGYVVTGGRKLITIDRPFDIIPVPSDIYEISPNVFVYDLSNTSTEQCYARAIIGSSTGNNISKIEVLDPGANYRKVLATVEPDASVGVSGNRAAMIRAVVSPDTGHGSDPEIELIAKYVCISGTFNGNATPIVANNTFRTFGLIKEPLYANCNLLLEPSTVKGSFTSGEKLYEFKSIKLAGTVEVFANSLVVGTNTAIIDSLKQDDAILITDGITNIFGYANNIAMYVPIGSDPELVDPVESLYIDVSQPDRVEAFAQSECDIYLVQKNDFAECVNFSLAELQLTDVNPSMFSASSYVLGEDSYASAKAANTTSYLTINDRDFGDFDAFNQLTRLIGLRENLLSTFNENETLVQASDNSVETTARLHSYESSEIPGEDVVYVTNIINNITSPGIISTDRNEGAQTRFEILNKYDGELVRDSGEILYVENIDSIRRNNQQTEVVKLILEF